MSSRANVARLARSLQDLRRTTGTGQIARVPESATALAEAVNLDLDDWQREFVLSPSPRRLLLTSRQSGKSTAAALSGLHTALSEPGALVIIVAPSLRQAAETFRKVSRMYATLGHPLPLDSERALGMELVNGSRIESLPSGERTVRGFSAPRKVIVDEASRIPDELISSILPMLARSGGSLDLLSTPHGRAGFFYESYRSDSFTSWTVRATDIPHRIPVSFLEEMRRTLSARVFRQEFLCSFEDVEDAVFSSNLIEAATSGPELEPTGGFRWTA